MHNNDWRYSEEKLKLRQSLLKILLKEYGETESTSSIYECANEWVEKGHVRADGVVKYYKAYFSAK
tara:strand:+ start:398 stop:595 length:198 start_codon:yes stop_codon:yes gene_type:complete